MKTDICIVGGGLVGLAAALTFSAQGRSVQLLESMNLQADEPAMMDARSLALSHSSIQIFRSLGLWQALQSATAAIHHIHVSSAGHFGVTRLDAAALNLDAMGYVVEYHRLVHLLLRAANQDSNIELISPATFIALENHPAKVALRYRNEETDHDLEAVLLVVADGAQSSVRAALDIETEVLDFEQNAIIANVGIDRPFSGVAYERFTRHGPMAMLPLPEQRYAMVWANNLQRTQSLMEMTQQEFTRELYACFGHRLGFFKQLGKRDQFPLKLTRAKQLVSGRCVLLGNAANTLHPVAGQGLNLALRDIAALYDQLSDLDLESEQIFERLDIYQQARKPDQEQTVRLGNSLVQLFSNDLPVLNHARAGALMALDLCPFIKREFSWLGMGYGSGVSSLMRGAL